MKNCKFSSIVFSFCCLFILSSCSKSLLQNNRESNNNCKIRFGFYTSEFYTKSIDFSDSSNLSSICREYLNDSIFTETVESFSFHQITRKKIRSYSLDTFLIKNDSDWYHFFNGKLMKYFSISDFIKNNSFRVYGPNGISFNLYSPKDIIPFKGDTVYQYDVAFYDDEATELDYGEAAFFHPYFGLVRTIGINSFYDLVSMDVQNRGCKNCQSCRYLKENNTWPIRVK